MILCELMTGSRECAKAVHQFNMNQAAKINFSPRLNTSEIDRPQQMDYDTMPFGKTPLLL